MGTLLQCSTYTGEGARMCVYGVWVNPDDTLYGVMFEAVDVCVESVLAPWYAVWVHLYTVTLVQFGDSVYENGIWVTWMTL